MYRYGVLVETIEFLVKTIKVKMYHQTSDDYCSNLLCNDESIVLKRITTVAPTNIEESYSHGSSL